MDIPPQQTDYKINDTVECDRSLPVPGRTTFRVVDAFNCGAMTISVSDLTGDRRQELVNQTRSMRCRVFVFPTSVRFGLGNAQAS